MSIPLAPLAGVADVALLVVRLVVGVVMAYYGWGKIRDPRRNARDFGGMGFEPGWLWGTLVLCVEFFGGLAVIAGLLTPIAAALIGAHMLTGFVWKLTTAGKPFPDYSYDLLLVALAIALLVTGPGALSLDRLLFARA